MTKALRDAAQALLDKLDGRRSFGVELLAAEFADERRALRAALAAPDRAQPAGEAAMPCGHHHSLMLKSAETGAHLYCELCDAQSGRRDAEQREAELQADLVEERNRIAGMRVEWAAEVATLTAQARHADDCLEAAQARIDALEHDWKERARADVGVLLATFHQEVWDAATAVDEGRPPVDYDLAGVETAKAIVESMHARDMRIAGLEAEGAKSERRAIEFGDALHRHILAMRAAFVAWHRAGPAEGMAWVINTLAGPGHLPSEADIAIGAQALFDKEVAEHEAFRAAHPGPAPAPSKPASAEAQTLRDAVQLPDMLAASEHAEPSGEEP